MKLTSRQKISSGMLVLAILAFVVDRTFFPPRAASAQLPSRRRDPAANILKVAPPAARDAATTDLPPDLSALSTRLQRAAQVSKACPDLVKDVFRPSPAWRARMGHPGVSLADQFRQHHHLLAVMVGGKIPLAIVDGKTVTIGQSIDGFRVNRIDEHAVGLESGEGHVELHMEK